LIKYASGNNLEAVTTPIISGPLAEQAEELIRALPGVVSVRVVGGDEGSVREVHILTTSEVPAKQTVRNVESALLAHLGVRIDHRRISVAATTEVPPPPLRPSPAAASVASASVAASNGERPRTAGLDASADMNGPKRRLYFEDVEVRGSRSRGVSCRVTLTKEGNPYVGEARGIDGDRARLELAARATCLAIGDADGHDRQFGLEGVRVFEAFERKFVFVGVTVRYGRDARLLSGTCEVIDSAETAAVLAVLDATNRWIEYGA
jgi:hypothetical protein